jgi:hypothetical protein
MELIRIASLGMKLMILKSLIFSLEWTNSKSQKLARTSPCCHNLKTLQNLSGRCVAFPRRSISGQKNSKSHCLAWAEMGLQHSPTHVQRHATLCTKDTEVALAAAKQQENPRHFYIPNPWTENCTYFVIAFEPAPAPINLCKLYSTC